MDVTNLFKNEDIVIICETHFGIRTKCPECFILIGRSNVIKSKKPRGDVAVYKNKHHDAELDVISVDFRDWILFKIRLADLLVAAVYIPPRNTLMKYISRTYS